MRILLHSHVFRPQVGGIETATHNLAVGLSDLGHEVIVLVDVLEPDDRDGIYRYRTVRTRSMPVRASWVRQSDIVHAVGPFPICFPLARLFGKPFSWTHANYRCSSIDGAGWYEGAPAPLEPWLSFQYACRKIGLLAAAVSYAKLLALRAIAYRVDANVAVSNHMDITQPLPRQVVLYNSVDVTNFRFADKAQAIAKIANPDCTFAFLGRLISEKGVDDLLHSFSLVIKTEPNLLNASLKIIGDGAERGHLERLAQDLGIKDRVFFAGSLVGSALKEAVQSAGIFVLPSVWQEPMGIAAVELMSAGKPLIVSDCGALAECTQGASLTFPHRNRQQLAAAMRSLALNQQEQYRLLEIGLVRAERFSVETIACDYERFFKGLIKRHNGLQ